MSYSFDHRGCDMNRWWVVLLCTVALPVVTGCHQQPAALADPGLPARGVRVTPSKLFTRELDRLAPHLDLIATGCVQLEASGGDLFFGFEPEVWEQGKPRFLRSWAQSRVRGPREALFSIREAHDPKEGWVYRVVASVADASGQRTSHSFTVAIPNVSGLSQVSRAVDLAGPRELAEGRRRSRCGRS